MLKVLRSTIMEVSVDTLWDVLRDFNAHSQWHPAIDNSAIEQDQSPLSVGCVRSFTLSDGQQLREKLLSLSDLEMTYSYCLLDTPIPLFNYVAHSRLVPVTDGNLSYWEWEASFNTRVDQEESMMALVGDSIFSTGFKAMRSYLSLPVQTTSA